MILFFILLSISVFFPVLFGTALWDDWAFVFRNAFMHQASTPLAFINGSESRAWPFFHTFMWMLLKLFKNHYQYYHLVSIFIQALNGYFCFLILQKLHLKNSLLLAILFLVHPLQLMTVAWIIQIKTLLSIFFLFLAILSILKYFEHDKIISFFLSILFFAFSVFSKSTTSIASICFLLSYPLMRKKLTVTEFLFLLLPFLLLSLLAISKTAWHAQYQFILQVAALSSFALFLLLQFDYFFRKNIYYILPASVFLTFLWFSSLIPPLGLILFLLLLLLCLLSFSTFQKCAKDHWILTTLICLILLVYFLSLDVSFMSYFKLVTANNVVLTLKNFIRYFIFIILPFNNLLLPASTEVTFSSFEFFQFFIFCSFFYLLYLHLKKTKQLLLQVGLAFYIMGILPFCGLIDMPIFSYSNFLPYWLSIPFFGLLPLYSHFIKSQKILILLVLSLLVITHVQSYRFIQTENIFLDSIKQSPNSSLLKVSLVEHYVFTGNCKKARSLLGHIDDQAILIEFSTEKKVNKCKESSR